MSGWMKVRSPPSRRYMRPLTRAARSSSSLHRSPNLQKTSPRSSPRLRPTGARARRQTWSRRPGWGASLARSLSPLCFLRARMLIIVVRAGTRASWWSSRRRRAPRGARGSCSTPCCLCAARRRSGRGRQGCFVSVTSLYAPLVVDPHALRLPSGALCGRGPPGGRCRRFLSAYHPSPCLSNRSLTGSSHPA